MIGNFIFFGIVGIVLVSVAYFTKGTSYLYHYMAAGVWLVLMGFSTWLIRADYQIKGFALRAQDILFRRGVIFRREVSIPFNRVQHCEIKQGPIERMFNLKTLEIFTAGGQASDLSIPGLLPDEAQQIKDFVIKNASRHEQDDL